MKQPTLIFYIQFKFPLHRKGGKKSANHMHFTEQTNINQAHKALQITTIIKQKFIWRWFTQYRLLVNHNKYTFQYIIINTGKWNISSRDAVSYRAFFNDALAQFIGSICHVDATDCLKTVWEDGATQKSLYSCRSKKLKVKDFMKHLQPHSSLYYCNCWMVNFSFKMSEKDIYYIYISLLIRDLKSSC